MAAVDAKTLRTIDGFHESMLTAFEMGEIPRDIYLRYLTHFSCNSHDKEDIAGTVAMMSEILENALKIGWAKSL